MVVDAITAALKQALLNRDEFTATTLRGLKGVVLNAEIAAGKRDAGLPDDEVIGLLQKEAKKRQEAADIYVQAGDQDRADKELRERSLIMTFLPEQLSDEELSVLIDKAITDTGAERMQDMGKVIGAVKAAAGARADGGAISRLVKERLA